MKSRSDVSIDFRVNNTITNDPCALCGGRCDPCGLDFMLADSLELICNKCAVKHAPDLCALVRQQAGDLFPGPRGSSVDHFIGVCLLCLEKALLIYIRGQGFYYCETDRVYWDQSCDRNAFQRGNEYDQGESDKNEARVSGSVYIEPEVKAVFDLIRKAQASKYAGPIGNDQILVEHVRHSAQCKLIYMAAGGACDCGPVGRWFEQVSAREYEAALPAVTLPGDPKHDLTDDDIPF